MSATPVRASLLGEMAAVDDVDRRLIELLRVDGRMAFRALGEALGLTESSVRARVRQLEAAGFMKVVAVADAAAAGFELLSARWVAWSPISGSVRAPGRRGRWSGGG